MMMQATNYVGSKDFSISENNNPNPNFQSTTNSCENNISSENNSADPRSAALVQLLVQDRFGEFRASARQAGNTVTALHELGPSAVLLGASDGCGVVGGASAGGAASLGAGGVDTSNSSKGRGGDKFMADLVKEVKEVNTCLAEVKKLSREIDTSTDQLLTATTTSKEKAVEARFEEICEQGNLELKKARDLLEQLDSRKPAKSSQERVKKKHVWQSRRKTLNNTEMVSTTTRLSDNH